jgi:hypothetical protein
MDPLDEELPVRERYEAPPPAVGSKEWLGNEVDRAFGFPSKPRSEPGVIDVTEGRRKVLIARLDENMQIDEWLDIEVIDVTGGAS